MFKLAVFVLAVVLSVASAQTSGNYYTFGPSGIACTVGNTNCPHFFLNEVNGGAVHVPIVNFVYSNANLDPVVVQGGASGEVVLFGAVNGYDFEIYEAYRLLPLISGAPTGALYTLHPSNYMCPVTGPCYRLKALALNNGTVTLATSYTEPYSSTISFIDTNWLADRIMASALVQGSVIGGVFTATGVYVKVDDQISCPASPQYMCAIGNVRAYNRDINRCWTLVGCVHSGICPHFLPACAAGYDLISVPSAPNGCNHFYCDASFLTQKH
ncbi:hypothetical protein SAMD00019534_071830 [Acytostelium subglobosum LB1]|uniref:hypothetical protein n=1 Tax=Acytostelium subglobosum LB1 TaxID=1410327 RepID=UPI0006447F48|nr:hypothetical protein SAMD00019534_071830 [Acytostelium subglobosum LB1]GAM24008.1 hypothetical protein SAMD00019534_071830 [Acytostelium subglobosum LB1]|eukprot:XP_012753044.1 hypothetical protein SAMD00019534_071830 [Acytostelium subglobosum LB1]